MNIIKHTYRFFRKRMKRLLCTLDTPFGAILMLHSIDDPDEQKLWANENLKLSPKTLAELIEYGKAHGCEFVSLDELCDAIKHKRHKRKLIAMTIDDGYRNNFEKGLPVFEKYEVPFCINVTTNVVEGKMLYWWYVLENLLLAHDQLRLNTGQVVSCATKEEKEKAFYTIGDTFLAMHQMDLKKHFKELLPDYDYDENYGAADMGMTWEQVQQLTTHPLATLGNHTVSHPYMQNCTIAETEAEVKEAQEILRLHLSQEMKTFAFPYGSHTEEERQMIKRMGFTSIQTVEWDYVQYGTDVFALPRMGVNERTWKEVMNKIIARC